MAHLWRSNSILFRILTLYIFRHTLANVRTTSSGKPKRYRGPPHICKKCNIECKSDKALQRHKRAEHMQLPREYASYSFNEDTKIFTCKICKLESEAKSAMVAHVLTHEQKFTCKICSATVYSAYRYSVHLYNHDKESGYNCPLCDYRTWHPPAVFLHITRMHLRRFAYNCKHCKKGYNDVVMYKEHENSHVFKQKISCVVCQKEFGYTRYLVAHQKQFHTVFTADPKMQNQCEICKKGFIAKRALDKHVAGAHKKTIDRYVHLCEWCGKSFKDKHSLNAHTTYHTGNKPHKCSYCDKTFAKKGSLVMHERIHNGEKPYVCHHCGKAFNQPTALKRHIRSHTGEKPYACGKCGVSFTSKMSLNKHSIRGCG